MAGSTIYLTRRFPIFCSDHPESVKINDVVRKSYELQAKHRVSNACSVVCGTLWKCLREAFGLETTIKYGMLKMAGINVGHMWLEYNGEKIDSTYVEDIPEDILEKIPGEYVEYSDEIKDKIFLGDAVTHKHNIPDHEIGLFLWAQKYPDRFVVTGLNLGHIGEYMTSVFEYVKKRYGKDVRIDVSLQQKMCRSCDEEKEKLKKCSKCLTAVYCSKECQIKDWKFVHKMACFKKGVDHRVL